MNELRQIFTVTAETISEYQKPPRLNIEQITAEHVSMTGATAENIEAVYNEILSRLPAQLWQADTTARGNLTHGARFGIYSYYLDYEEDGKKRGKIPRRVDPKTLNGLRMTSEQITFYAQSFSVAVAAFIKHCQKIGWDKISFGHNAGIGYRVQYAPANRLGVWVIDLDHCRNAETGEILETALDIIKAVNSYTEISPSGTGFHIWLTAPTPDNVAMFEAAYTATPKRKDTGLDFDIEIYGNNKIMRLSGNQYGDYGNTLDGEPQAVEATAQLETLLNKYCKKAETETTYQRPQQMPAAVSIDGLNPLPTIEKFLQYVDNVKAKRAQKIARGESPAPNRLIPLFEPVPVATLDGLREYCAEKLGNDNRSKTLFIAIPIIYRNLCNPMRCIVNQTEESTAALTDFLYRLLALCPRSIYNQCNYRNSKYNPGKESAVWQHDIKKALADLTPEYKPQETAAAVVAPSVEDVAAMVESMTKETLSATLQETARDFIALEKAGRTDEAKAIMDKAIAVKRKDAFNKAIAAVRKEEKATEKEVSALVSLAASNAPAWVHFSDTKTPRPLATLQNLEIYLRDIDAQPRYNALSDRLEIYERQQDGAYQLSLMDADTFFSKVLSGLTVHLMPGVNFDKVAKFTKAIAKTKFAYNPFHDFLMKAAAHHADMGKPMTEIEKYFNLLELDDEAKADYDFYLYLFKYWMVQAVRIAFNSKLHHQEPQGILILQSVQQMAGKSTFAKRILPENLGLTKEVNNIDPNDRDKYKEAITAAVVELSEFGKVNRSTLRDNLKAFISRGLDEYRSPYDRDTSIRPRMTSFIATLNDITFLKDDTGARRYWIIPVKRGDKGALEDRLNEIDIWSMWGEALALSENKSAYPIGHLPLDILEKLENKNKDYAAPSPTEQALLDSYQWGEQPTGSNWKKSKQIAIECGIPLNKVNHVARLLKTYAKQKRYPILERVARTKQSEFLLPPPHGTLRNGEFEEVPY